MNDDILPVTKSELCAVAVEMKGERTVIFVAVESEGKEEKTL